MPQIVVNMEASLLEVALACANSGISALTKKGGNLRYPLSKHTLRVLCLLLYIS